MKEKILYWIPRVLTILAILFMMMFSLDVFGGKEPLSRQLLGFLIHNIPAWILIVVLIIAWKWEMAGGLLFIISSVTGGSIFFMHTHMIGSLIVMAPFLVVGLLFILHYRLYVRGNEAKS